MFDAEMYKSSKLSALNRTWQSKTFPRRGLMEWLSVPSFTAISQMLSISTA